MTTEDAILIATLAAEDAVRLAVRQWGGHASANRYQAAQLPGSPLRISGLMSTDAARKSGERTLDDMADDGLLRVARARSLKFPMVALTAEGDARARALADLPGLDVGHKLLLAAVEWGKLYPETASGRWVPEIDFNFGKGWGESTREDRLGLAQVELDALPAIAAGWMRAHSSITGNAAYAVTPAGLKAARGPAPKLLKSVEPVDGGTAMYRREQDAKLGEMDRTPPPNRMEIGELPLVGCEVGSRRFPTKPSKRGKS